MLRTTRSLHASTCALYQPAHGTTRRGHPPVFKNTFSMLFKIQINVTFLERRVKKRKNVESVVKVFTLLNLELLKLLL